MKVREEKRSATVEVCEMTGKHAGPTRYALTGLAVICVLVAWLVVCPPGLLAEYSAQG